ncbi:unnamed protein product [Linum trigynum]|uniref:Pentatricopeptide repeat-containing protein n=1 Tax=Linum trigynum TaxID=586398 RepID=A0AAV2GEQ6_9ROSI
MNLQLLHRISHRIRYFHAAAPAPLSETSVSDELVSVIEASNPMEPELDAMVPFLSPAAVASVIQQPPNPQLGFRFFIWASRYKRFRTWESRDAILRMLGDEKGMDLYRQVLEETKRCKFEVPAEAFLVLIQACGKRGMDEKAVEAFGSMAEFNCKPDVYTYNALLQILLRKGVTSLALAIYHQMMKLNCVPDRNTFGILIGGLCQCGETRIAQALFNRMEEIGILPDKVIYTVVISALCQDKTIDYARNLLDKMKSEGIEPDSVTYAALLNGYCKLGRIDEALACLGSFEKEGYVLEARGYSCLIDGFYRAKRYEEVDIWYRKMISSDITPDVVVYTILTKGLSARGKMNEAMKLLNEMNKRGVVPDTQCYNVLIKGLCDIGLVDEAKSLSLEISKHDQVPTAYTHTILISGMCKNGLVSEAQQLFKAMDKSGCGSSVVTFNALINGLCKSGNLEEAKKMIHAMERSEAFLGLQIFGNSLKYSLEKDGDGLERIKNGNSEPGLILKEYNSLVKLDEKVVADIRTYNILINEYCKAGNIDEAFKQFKLLPCRGLLPDSVTYGTLIDGLFRLKRDKEAEELFRKMLESGLTPSTAVVKSLMTWSCRRKNLSSAFNLWLKYLKSVAGRDDNAIKAIEELSEKGEIAMAVKSLLEMDLRLNDFQLAPYTIWLIGLCQSGRIEEASMVFSILDKSKVAITPPSCANLIKAILLGPSLPMKQSHSIRLFFPLGYSFLLEQWPDLTSVATGVIITSLEGWYRIWKLSNWGSWSHGRSETHGWENYSLFCL